jgi:hypothetical protein
MASGVYSQLTMLVAFAKLSGVQRMGPALQEFRASGGRVTAFVGIDYDGTSLEALLALLGLSDELFVVHVESTGQAFHPKVYDLSGNDAAWRAVGSNNLTAGGLWSNIEAFVFTESDLTTETESSERTWLGAAVDSLRADDYGASLRITSTADIDRLAKSGYVASEVSERLARSRAKKTLHGPRLFGRSVPALVPSLLAARDEDSPHADGRVRPSTSAPATAAQAPAASIEHEDTGIEDHEIAWFETRGMTGGSGNQLDLSKTGRIQCGSAAGTRYATAKALVMRGGAAFFAVDPEASGQVRTITVNMDGRDYEGCTVKMHIEGVRPNGSWRIQLQGTDPLTSSSLEHDAGDLRSKVLAFEAITDGYYVMTVYPESDLPQFISASKVAARNGNSPTSRYYGIL